MKAEEVQRRYAAGERNFSGANLRGHNFKGQDFSGNVTNAIGQIPSSAEGDRLKNLLVELQTAIETDPKLPDDGKQTALEQVKQLASAAQESNPEKTQSIAKRASQMLKGIAASLPDAASLVDWSLD